MNGICRKFRLACLLFGLLLVVVGCKNGITKHNINLKGVEHGKKLYSHGAKACTACHGVALQGNGWIPSCYSCHNVMWNKKDHKIARGGILHKAGKPTKVVCAKCHGADLKGSGKLRPSCYKCHGDVWTSVDASHTFKRGYAYHQPKLYRPKTYCVQCHGADLKGNSSRPSCYSCHGPKWTQFSSTHSLKLGGAQHKTRPMIVQGRCTVCHGANLKGSDIGPSCYSCHNDKWTALAAIHIRNIGGAQHGANPYAPTANCSSCHGSDLKGVGTAPSCYACHSTNWIKTNHGKSEHGILHGFNNRQPITYCAPCHGANLTGGTPPEAPLRSANSCYQCHGRVW